ncbi:MAG: tetratricopeptide repeat protein, partial [Acidobacteria bacterium]|nr:tetratricopeptide repeat protein [Acidobacteriota bacterium]
GPEVAAVAPPAPAPWIPGPLPLEKPAAPAAEGLIWRGEPASEEAMLDAALAPYRSGDYPDAIRRLERFVGQHPRSAEGHFYLGVSLLFAGRNPEAAAALERAKALAGKTLAREAAWYLALAWQRQGLIGPALAELRRLCDEPGEHQSAACEALREPPRR